MLSSPPRLTWLAAVLFALPLAGCIGLTGEPEERPFSTAVDDFNTQTELNARLLAESGKLFANVNTTVIEGRVHLSGSVATNDERLKATRIAWETPNVREVVNDIEVNEAIGIGEIARDRWINTQVRARILTDSGVRDSNYTIDTQNCVVYVHGIAQNQAELDRVLRHARAVDEVKRVVNYVVLKDDPRRHVPQPETYAHSEPEDDVFSSEPE